MKIIIAKTREGREHNIYVDDEDYPLLSRHSWCVSGGRRKYAVSKLGHAESIYMHRLVMNPDHRLIVDHKDGNGLNNQKDNLRVCSQSSNTKNQKLSTISSTGYKGVHNFKQYGNYMAQITVNYKKIFLGYYETKEEAAKAYNEAAIKYHGEFAKLNQIPCVV